MEKISKLVFLFILISSVGFSQGKTWKTKSVLADGTWYKIAVQQSGPFRITQNVIKDLGINPSAVDPDNIRIYGNGGAMLPQYCGEEIIDDLQENPVLVKGGGDGNFGSTDHVLFYAKGPSDWQFFPSQDEYRHELNDYSDTAFYFLKITTGVVSPKLEFSPAPPSALYETSQFDYLAFHEQEKRTDISDNVKTGRDWFGEKFDSRVPKTFSFSLPMVPTEVKMTTELSARGENSSFFQVSINGKSLYKEVLSSVNTADYEANYVSIGRTTETFVPGSRNLDVQIYYNQLEADDYGWLNYIRINARCPLVYLGETLHFQDKNSRGKGSAKYKLTTNGKYPEIWRITDNLPMKVNYSMAGNEVHFIAEADTVEKFVVFNPEKAPVPQAMGRVKNQNLHGLQPVDYLIITHPRFLSQARKLGEFHKIQDGMSYQVVTPQKIYNEFSSGNQDISAIRNFVKMLYDRGLQSGKELQYLVLFGDASYDYKDRLLNNSNLVPTYQSSNSHSPINSYLTDDFFGYLDDNEGELDQIKKGLNYDLDIAIGRIPVTEVGQAEMVLNKIIHYTTKNSHGDWRNILTFFADDMDEGWEEVFVKDSEVLIGDVNKKYKAYNTVRVYSDAFEQKSTPSGSSYPDAQTKLTQRVEEGTFFVHYFGHGGEVGLTSEQVLDVEEIRSWKNYDALTLFITATCEFTRFDDPERISAGEWVLLNPNGGGVALLSTTRLVYSSSNTHLMKKLMINNFFERKNGRYQRLGEIFTLAKNRADGSSLNLNNRKFVLIGDPALKLPFPEMKVNISTINGDSLDTIPGSMKALGKYTITGNVSDHNGNILTGYNGIVYPTIYDKPEAQFTLANDPPESQPLKFNSQESIIYRGKASVKNGKFSFTFVVPKDISYKDDMGKISFYSSDEKIDGNGFHELMIGGTAKDFIVDNDPPSVKLYMDDENFKFGGITGENPTLIAKIFDENGINTVGNSIGHEPKAYLNLGEPFYLGNHYQAGLDDYKSGIIRYPLKNLPEGRHRIDVKVYDVANNLGAGYTEFVVVNSNSFTIENLINFPNPWSTQTSFQFEHNHPNELINVRIQIFKMNGQLVTEIVRDLFSEGSRSEPITWKGNNPGTGNPIDPGVYVYRVILTSQDGQVTTQSNKMIYFK